MRDACLKCGWGGRAADVTADTYTVCYSLGRKAFDELLGPIEDVWRFEALRKVPVLFALSEQQLFELARCMKYHTISAGQMVFRQGDPGAHPSPCDESTGTRTHACMKDPCDWASIVALAGDC
jgi:hypothetical protein